MGRLYVPVNPVVMKWCRKKAGYDINTAAKKIGRPGEDIIKWEQGTLQPTLPQARDAAKVYKRPLAVFLLPEPPRDFSPLRDFRTLPTDYNTEHSPALADIIRETHVRQEWTKEFLSNEGIEPLKFVGSASQNTNSSKLALSIRETLGIRPDDQIKCSSRYDALQLWKKAAEKAGIFVFHRNDIDYKEARGFALSDKMAPFVFVNPTDAKAGQLFTLAHELCHIWINETGVSNMEGLDPRKKDEETQIEIYCNKVAAELLLERGSFNKELEKQSSQINIKERIENLSKIFKVSEEAVARRLLDNNSIRARDYQDLRSFYQDRWREIQQEEKKERKKRRSRGPSYYTLKVFYYGHAYTRVVLSAYKAGFASGRETSSLLDIKLNNLNKLAKTAGIPMDFSRS